MAFHAADLHISGLLGSEDDSEGDINLSSSSELPIHEFEKQNPPKENFNLLKRLRWIGIKLLRMPPSIFIPRRLLKFLYLLAPSFLQSSYEYKTSTNPTAWLGGLRGVAALLVFSGHFNEVWWPYLQLGYASAGESTTSIFQLPILRVTNTGGASMVCIFFIISGYVLSYSCLRKIRDKDSTAVFNILVSAVFRRWFRIFLPVSVATFTMMLIAWSGLWVAPRPGLELYPKETFSAQLGEWWMDFVNLTTASFHPGNFPLPYYCPQLWTITREYRGSLFIYMALLCLAKTREGVRIGFTAFLVWYLIWISEWELSLFFFGMLAADLQFLHQDLLQSNEYSFLSVRLPDCILRYSHIILHGLSLFLVLFGINLMCVPNNAKETPLYRVFDFMIPNGYNGPRRFPESAGAGMFMIGMWLSPPSESTAPLLQRPFRTAFAQYLGEISFGLYVTHMHIVAPIGGRIYNHWAVGEGKPYVTAYLIALIVNTFLSFWVADLFWRGVDRKSVLLARQLADRCFVKD